jgi:hypothetical protein
MGMWPPVVGSASGSACAVPRMRNVFCQRQRGAFAVMTVPLVLLVFVFLGFAIELGMVYNRKTELQTVADTIALAAADKLDGTATGISNAGTVAANAAANLLYNYNGQSVDWSPSAITFSSSPDGPDWLDAQSASAKPADLFFVKVDTAQLDAKHGRITTIFMQIWSDANAEVMVGSHAVAGRSKINVLPLALCEMSSLATDSRNGEMVQYGFRRGVTYSLTELNPDTVAQPNTGVNYLVNPVAPPGTNGTSVISNTALIQPHVCTGTMEMPRVTGGTITVEQGFPLASVYQQLNSRFGSYTSPCTSDTAPPDANVKEYKNSGDFKWMATQPGPTAVKSTHDNQWKTILDQRLTDPPSDAVENYGPLWIYAKAAKYSAAPEPPGGYATYSANNTDWGNLYLPKKPQVSSTFTYPSPTPYGATGGATFLGPSGGLKGVRDRRVLNIPILECPVSGGSPAAARVAAIAKFFMTQQATDQKLYAEFAGLVLESTLGGQVELYR